MSHNDELYKNTDLYSHNALARQGIIYFTPSVP